MLQRHIYGPRGGSRTLNIPGLNRTPLPIGLPTDMCGGRGRNRTFVPRASTECSTVELPSLKWSPRRDSNSHALRHWFLRPACLPIPPPGDISKVHTSHTLGSFYVSPTQSPRPSLDCFFVPFKMVCLTEFESVSPESQSGALVLF